jgi:hypothetical protein
MSAAISNAGSERLTTVRLTEVELAVLKTHLEDFKKTASSERKALLKGIYKEVRVLSNNRSLPADKWKKKTRVSIYSK